MSNFASLQTALTGLRGGQVGLNTAAHNIANANTPGFTRQRVEFATRPAYASPVGPAGTGVEVSDIARTRDQFLDARVRSSSRDSEEMLVRADLLGRVESLLAEPENGVSGELGELWSAFEDLSMQPADAASRRQVLSSLQSLTGRIRTISEGWDRLAADTTERHKVSVDEVNGLLDQVAWLNKANPATLAREGTPNDLMDARDLALDELSAKLGVTVTTETDGTVSVALDGLALVTGTTATHVDIGAGPSLSAGGTPLTPHGELGGLQEFLTVDLPAVRDELDTFTDALVSELNAQHAAGRTADGTAGGPLLGYSVAAGTPGRSSALTVAITQPGDLAAADTTGAALEHNGGNALLLGDLRTTSSIDERVRALATDLGRKVASADTAAESQAGLAASASYARMNQHGVSLDEEMVALVQFQRSLEAASRMMTAIDSALDTLINRTGLVGR